jgi:hypothetical protein
MTLSKFKKFLGYAWAAPVTLLGLLYVTLFWAMGWYNWGGIVDDGMIWEVNHEKTPSWLKNYWRRWGGHAIGNVVVLKQSIMDSRETLTHELRHVEQVMRLGVFQPIIYGINLVAMRIGCPGTHPYYYNPFEVDARRVAGQKIEVRK